MKIIKVYPHNYPLHSKQNASIVSASIPYVNYSIHDIKVISSYSKEKILDSKIIYLGSGNFDSLKKDSDISDNISNLVSYNDYLKEVVKEIQKNKPDLVEVELDLDLAADIALKVKNTPVVLISHLNLIKSSIFKNIKRFFKIKKIYSFIFVSRYFKKKFLNFYPFYKNKAYVVHNSYKHIKEELIINTNKENQIIFVGRATKKKGIKEYFEGVSLFLQNNNNWKAVFVGSLEQQKEIDYLNSLTESPLINNLIKEGKIIIFKNLSNREAFLKLQQSKVAVFPTIPKKHQEGIPMVALEAGIAQCLIISSSSGGYLEINPFKEAIIKKVSAAAIYKKLNYFCKNEKMLEELSKKQHKFIKEEFLFNKLIKRFDKVRENILKNYRKTL